MDGDKHFKGNLPKYLSADDEAAELSAIKAMIGRAAVVYVVLFIGLGVAMSALGIDPLVNAGFMPKALLLFVGLALLIAVINRLVYFSQESGQSWWQLLVGLAHLRSNQTSSGKCNLWK